MIMCPEDILDLPATKPDVYQPCVASFEPGDKAWGMSANETWFYVTICSIEDWVSPNGELVRVYSAAWTRDGYRLRALFSPAAGDLKPEDFRPRPEIVEDGALRRSLL